MGTCLVCLFEEFIACGFIALGDALDILLGEAQVDELFVECDVTDVELHAVVEDEVEGGHHSIAFIDIQPGACQQLPDLASLLVYDQYGTI